MTDEHKLATIKVVFANGSIEVFKNVEDLHLDEYVARLSIAGHAYYTQIILDKVVYFEEVIDDNSVTYYADGIAYTMRDEEKTHD